MLETKMRSRFKGYCSRCHHTIWMNEEIRFDGQARHLDCSRALLDKTPRVMDKRYEHILGKSKKKKLRAALLRKADAAGGVTNTKKEAQYVR